MQPQSGMKAGYKYDRIVCPMCHKEIGDNWYIRHMKKYHPIDIKDSIMSKLVAVKTLDGVEVHLPDVTGNWYTLCSMAGADDNPAVQQKIVDVPRGAKVDCVQCREIWKLAQEFSARDFEK